MEETQNRTGPTTVWVDAFKVGDLVAHPRYGEQRYTETQLLEALGGRHTWFDDEW